MAERQSVTADFHRPFSGKPSTSVVDAHDSHGDSNCHGEPLPSMEAAREMLLQLREAMTSADFDRLLNGVTESTTSETTTTSEVDVEASDDDNMEATLHQATEIPPMTTGWPVQVTPVV